MPVPLLLVHGFPHGRTAWSRQRTSLADVAEVTAPSLRGFDEGPDAVVPKLTLDGYASELARGLTGPTVVCGLSMGGYVALALAARFPQHLRGLVLCNTRAGADSEEARKGRYVTAERVAREGMGFLADAMLPKMLSPGFVARSPAVAAEVRAMMARQPVGAVMAALHAMASRPDRTAMLGSIRVPTLVITGSADTLIPASESEALAAAIPGARLVVLPGAAHLSNVEAPEAFDQAIREFLGGLA